ncbi:MAG: DUF1674 domain-containing protein [Pseudomonadota bacterium]
MSDADAPEEARPKEPDAASSEVERAARIEAAAKRALAEAAARRDAERPLALPKEEGGREGPEPVRFGDWEKKGIAYDF